MQEGGWAKVGVVATVIGTIIALATYFNSKIPSEESKTNHEGNLQPTAAQTVRKPQASRPTGNPTPASTPASTNLPSSTPQRLVNNRADLNGDGVNEYFDQRVIDPPSFTYNIYRNGINIGLMYADVIFIMPTKTTGYYDIGAFIKDQVNVPEDTKVGVNGTMKIFKWDGTSYPYFPSSAVRTNIREDN